MAPAVSGCWGGGHMATQHVLTDETHAALHLWELLRRARTASALWQLLFFQTNKPGHPPKMPPPKQPIEPQKTSVASTPPVF